MNGINKPLFLVALCIFEIFGVHAIDDKCGLKKSEQEKCQCTFKYISVQNINKLLSLKSWNDAKCW